ncbi:hypothetical protein NQZ68_027828 [Dissostichus eleginoides]|nr:hypothetical protein NQZ68_027828 [Dissostichus eleginoides]
MMNTPTCNSHNTWPSSRDSLRRRRRPCSRCWLWLNAALLNLYVQQRSADSASPCFRSDKAAQGHRPVMGLFTALLPDHQSFSGSSAGGEKSLPAPRAKKTLKRGWI